MSAERGQALVVMVAVVGLAALVLVSLREADERIVSRARAQRAAEGAAEAAGAVVADRLLAFSRDGVPDIVESALADAPLADRAAEAAREVLVALGASLERIAVERRVDEVSVRVEVARGGVRASARVGVRSR